MPAICEWHDSDRPRERLESLNAGVLPVRELLAIILGSGSTGRSALDLGTDVLARFGGSLRRLGMAEPAELRAIPGIGPARAATITAALEIGRRLATEPSRQCGAAARPDRVKHALNVRYMPVNGNLGRPGVARS